MTAPKQSPAARGVRAAGQPAAGSAGAASTPSMPRRTANRHHPARTPGFPATGARGRGIGWPVALTLSLLIHGGGLAAAHWLGAARLQGPVAPADARSPVALAVLLVAPGGAAPTSNAAPASQPTTAATADTDAPTPANTDMDADTAAAPATPRADAMAELLQAPPTPAVADGPEPPTAGTTPPAPEDGSEPVAMADGTARTPAPPSPEPAAAPATVRPAPAAIAPATPATPAAPGAPKTRQTVAAKPDGAGGRREPASPTRRSSVRAERHAEVAADNGPAAAKKLRGLAALDAEIAADRTHTEMDPARPAAAPPATDGDLSGLAALDAEIAADRHQARHTGSAGRAAGPGLGAEQGAEQGAKPRAEPRAERADADTRKSGAATRGLAERRYLSALRQALERERHYPPTARRRRLEGTTRVQFTIAADGAFSGIHVSRSAGAASLDEAAVSTVRRLARFDPIPAAVGRSRWTVHVPIVFRLN